MVPAVVTSPEPFRCVVTPHLADERRALIEQRNDTCTLPAAVRDQHIDVLRPQIERPHIMAYNLLVAIETSDGQQNVQCVRDQGTCLFAADVARSGEPFIFHNHHIVAKRAAAGVMSRVCDDLLPLKRRPEIWQLPHPLPLGSQLASAVVISDDQGVVRRAL